MQCFSRDRFIPRLTFGKLHVLWSTDVLQHVRRVTLQALIRADEVILNSARLAQVIYGHPVLVHALGVLVQQVAHELRKRHVVPGYFHVLRVTFPVTADDLGAVFALVGLDLAQLVAVSREQARHRLAHEHELEVVAQAVADLLRREVGEEEQVGVVVHLHLDVHVGQRATQHLQHSLPVGAGHLGHIAVEEAVLLVHQDVLQKGLPLRRAERPHAVSSVLVAAHRPDSAVTDILQNLRKKKRVGKRDEYMQE